MRKIVLVDVLPGLNAEHARHIVDFVNGPATFPDSTTSWHGPSSSIRRGASRHCDAGSCTTPFSSTTEAGCGVIRAGDSTMGSSRWPSQRLGERRALFDDLLDTLGRIKVPLLLARGMRPDSVLRDDDEAELLRRLPSAEVVHFEEAGHSIQGDMPVALAATIKAFIF